VSHFTRLDSDAATQEPGREVVWRRQQLMNYVAELSAPATPDRREGASPAELFQHGAGHHYSPCMTPEELRLC
jgi:hypothetical protein